MLHTELVEEVFLQKLCVKSPHTTTTTTAAATTTTTTTTNNSANHYYYLLPLFTLLLPASVGVALGFEDKTQGEERQIVKAT